ncbi:MAG: MFS transporter [Sulfolobaceae archaeon]
MNIRALIGGTIGWIVDVFDLTLILFITNIISSTFFPTFSPTAQLLLVFSSYALTLLARPVGGIVFGNLADRLGRRIIMMITLLGLGISTALTGVLPTYSEIGILASILFVLLRLIVGIFVGGEVSGSHLIAIEESEKRFRGLSSGILQSGYYWGYSLAAFTFLGLVAYFGSAFSSIGWRYAFYIGLLVAIVGILLRITVGESALFSDIKNKGRIERIPVATLFREHGKEVLKVLLLLCGIYWVAYSTLGFLPTYLISFLRYPRDFVLTALGFASIIGAILTIIGGTLSNLLGRKRSFILYIAIGIIFSYPSIILLLGNNIFLVTLGSGLLVGLVGLSGGIMLAHISELFPTRVRASAVGFLWNTANIGSAVALILAPIIARDVLGYFLLIISGYIVGLIGAIVNKDKTGTDLSY